MTIRVLFWSYFRERVGAESAEVSISEGARVADLLSAVHERWPVLEPLKGCTLVAVGLDYADPQQVLRSGDEVSLFPPVQGG
jgi:molybdopterin converting factor small subunit